MIVVGETGSGKTTQLTQVQYSTVLDAGVSGAAPMLHIMFHTCRVVHVIQFDLLTYRCGMFNV